MKNINIHEEYYQIFETYPDIKLEDHISKLIELDQFLPYNSTFYCITNTVEQSFEYVSKNFKACTGLDPELMLNGGMNYFWTLFHPSDIGLWINCLKELMEFTMSELSDDQRKKMSYTWNYRIKNGDGQYVNIVQNTTPLQFDENKKPIIGLAHYTVLNEHINLNICASGKILNAQNEYETLFFKNMSSTNLLDGISKRERDIVRLLVINKTSEEIADNLNISKHTVDTHRRNILKKLNVSSTAELTAYFKNYPRF